jgi:hypothetical protein
MRLLKFSIAADRVAAFDFVIYGVLSGQGCFCCFVSTLFWRGCFCGGILQRTSLFTALCIGIGFRCCA